MEQFALQDIDELINMAQWSEALLILDRKQKIQPLSKSELLKSGLIHFNLRLYDKGLALFEMADLSHYSDCAWLRRRVITPLIHSKNYIWAENVLQLILKNHPHSIPDLTTLNSILIRQHKRLEACTYLERILALENANYEVVAQIIQIKFQENQLEEAVQLAERYASAYELNERLFKIALIVLIKAKKFQFCIDKISTIDFSKLPLDIGILAAQVAYESKNYSLVELIIARLQAVGYESARMGLILAKTKLKAQDNETKAVEILLKAHELDADDIPINSLLGELLLKSGHHKQALFYLEKLKRLTPTNPQTRLLNARALKFNAKYDDAANEMLEVIKLLPEVVKWKRYAASALGQAGRYDEAKKIFDEGLAIRNKELPETFEQGISLLENKVEQMNLPTARFDWLWRMIESTNLQEKYSRSSYEKSAKWVNLLDHFLVDWLECRPHQADEAMMFFDDLSEVYATLNDSMSAGKGVILAGAHVGPLFAIPLSLDLLGLPHKWLASTPSISSMSYKETMISTSENTETEVVRQIIKSLQQGDIVALAVDGAINPSAPRVDFENQKVTYSDFAAKMSFRTKAPSFLIVSSWEEHKFCINLVPMPAPHEDEKLEEFSTRWTQNYFSELKDYLINKPGNARLGGGIWRDIK